MAEVEFTDIVVEALSPGINELRIILTDGNGEPLASISATPELKILYRLQRISRRPFPIH